MKATLQIFAYLTWAAWLLAAVMPSAKPRSPDTHGAPSLRALLGMVLSTFAILALFFWVNFDYQIATHIYPDQYTYKVQKDKREIVIGKSESGADIALENPHADDTHVRLSLQPDHFLIGNISRGKRVDVNGRYLNKWRLGAGDIIEIDGRDQIRVKSIGRQFPLGRSMQLEIKTGANQKAKTITLYSFLSKGITIRYARVKEPSAGFAALLLPGQQSESAASLSYEFGSAFLGVINPYYMVVFLVILLFSLALFLYLKNQFNGALVLLFLASLPFAAGLVGIKTQLTVLALFVIPILYCQRRRRCRWRWGTFAVIFGFGALFLMPEVLNMTGDFTFTASGPIDAHTLKLSRSGEDFFLRDMRDKLSYDRSHTLILGYTVYRLSISDDTVVILPVNPERLRVSENPSLIISDLQAVEPGKNYVHLKYPKSFTPVEAGQLAENDRITITDDVGNAIVLSKIKRDSYGSFSKGLMFIIAAFWLFWILNHISPSLGRWRFLRFNIFTTHNAFVYNFVFFMLSLGYIMFGALALQNNYFLKNFEKYRSQALVWFVLGFFLFTLLGFYNRWVIFAARLLTQKKFQFPLAVSLILVLLGRFSPVFPAAAAAYLLFVFIMRLRRDVVYEYINTHSMPLVLKEVNEKSIAGLKEVENQRMFFGLGRALYNQGWDYITSADLLLLISLFFIVMQVFLGGELGVSVAGFFFLPIEMGKILLTIYFADWVSRIDKGMRLNVLWIYGLVLVPFLLLIVFLKDFSPLLVFAFVFLYHIIKINKPTAFKIILITFILATLFVTVIHVRVYAFPFTMAPYNYIISALIILLFAVFMLRIGLGKYRKMKVYKKAVATVLLIVLAVGIGAVIWKYEGSVPRVLGDRLNSWLNPWQDYHLSYQFVNSLWMMKGTGLMGKSTAALEVASHVPLIEQDLSFSLYVSVLGWAGVALIFATLMVLAVGVYRLAVRMFDSPYRWEVYVLEFLTVIFAAQFVFPALYVVGLLPIMSQPLPFLSYSNNMLLLFTLPFFILMMVLIKNMEKP